MNIMNKKTIISILTIITISAVSIAWWQGRPAQPQKYTGPVEKMTFGVATSLLPSMVWVAENKGYFQEEGLDVTIREFDSGKTALATMLEEGGLDMVTTAQTPVMLNSFKRNDYAIIAGVFYSNDNVRILARKDLGIQTPADLAGKKIGITMGSTGHYFLDVFLSFSGLEFSEVETVDFKATELPQALADGKVEAISSWEPNIHNAQKLLGDKALFLSKPGIFREDFYLVPNKDFIKNHPDVLKRSLKAMVKAEKFMQENPGETKDIVSQRLKLDREFVSSVWDIFTFKLFLDQTILITLEDEAGWAIDNKFTNATKVPNYLDFIYFDALEAVKPEAVTIIH